jgi:hypothetical protein
MRYVPLKCRFLQEPHGVTSQKTPFFIVTAVKTSSLTSSQKVLAEIYLRKVPQIERNTIVCARGTCAQLCVRVALVRMSHDFCGNQTERVQAWDNSIADVRASTTVWTFPALATITE